MLAAPTLGDLLRTAAQQQPHSLAFQYRSESIDYGEWDELAERAAGGFAAHGIRQGDVVALLLPSTPFFFIAYLAAARLGAVTAGINARYRRQEIGHILRQSGAKLLVAVERWHDADFRSAVEQQRSELPDLGSAIWIAADDLRRDTRSVVQQVASGGVRTTTATVDPDDPAAIVFTSGTTGVPKGAWYSHRNLLALAEIDTRRYAGGQIPFRKHLAAGLSFAHIGTMGRIAIQIGHCGLSIIHDAFDPGAVLETIEHERLQHLGGIPTQIVMLLEHPDRSRRDLTSLRSVLLGGAPSSPELIGRIQRELNVVISMRYSSTEVGIATASLPHDSIETLMTTVGKATAGVELRIVDDSNRRLEEGQIGAVVVRSPATMRGYWRDTDATSATIDADGWIHTGDLGFIDAAGYLHLCGRQTEMFIRGGYNVYPGEVENLLAQHPKVGRVAVLGVPNDKFGEIGWVFVVPRERLAPPSLDELRQYVGAELASFKRPDGLSVVDELPVTPMFKVDKRALRALFEGENNG